MYSRLIAWLKILLPFAALALLSTIFLYSRGPDPIATIPIFEDGEDPARSEQVSAPFFAGTTEAGHAITLSARKARLANGNAASFTVDDVQAVVDTTEGSRITIDAKAAHVVDGNVLQLRDRVQLTSSNGYVLQSEGFDADTSRLTIESTGPVSGNGPGLTLAAGRMRVTESEGAGDLQLLFTDGVKMIYVPQEDEADK